MIAEIFNFTGDDVGKVCSLDDRIRGMVENENTPESDSIYFFPCTYGHEKGHQNVFMHAWYVFPTRIANMAHIPYDFSRGLAGEQIRK